MKEIAYMPDGFMDCFYARFKKGIFNQRKNTDNCNFDINKTINKTLWVEEIFKKIQMKHPNVIFINSNDIQCAGGTCLSDINNVPIYRDEGHLTDYASYQLGIKYINEIGNPLK